MAEPVFMIFFAALIGACLGSFANVAALRSLTGEDWVSQPSACFNCGQKLTFAQNLPLFGFLHHGGTAACCGAPLPRRYILVELAMAGLAVIAIVSLGVQQALIFMPFIVLQAVMFLTDYDDFIIPDWASLGGTALGLFINLLPITSLPTMVMALAGGALGYGLIFTINALYKFVRGQDGLGMGDAKLMMCFGVWLGPVSLLPILFAASIAGSMFGIAAILWARRHSDVAPVQLPFGCFLAPMALAWLFFVPEIQISL